MQPSDQSINVPPTSDAFVPTQSQQNVTTVAATPLATVISGLSGNEMYCLHSLGYSPGNILVGNSVYSMGILGSLKSGFKGIVGGEITSFTEMIHEGRMLSYNRLTAEMQQHGGSGVSGVTSELVFHGGNIEFLSVGSAIHSTSGQEGEFTSSSDGQELFSQIDAGYTPKSFVFGNVAYSIGIGRGIGGAFRQLAKGEVRQYSDIFTQTRQLALNRVIDDARSVGANAVVGIRTSILPFGTSGVQEMIMIGTASYHPAASNLNNVSGITTSDMTAEETWNMTKLGYMPIELVLGTSVYSIGIIGGFKSLMQSFVKGEINEMTQLIYGAREESLGKVQQQAQALGADSVLGVKTYVYDLGGGLIEFLAIGTAIKKVEGTTTQSEQLPPQAIIRDKDTFSNTAEYNFGIDLNEQNA